MSTDTGNVHDRSSKTFHRRYSNTSSFQPKPIDGSFFEVPKIPDKLYRYGRGSSTSDELRQSAKSSSEVTLSSDHTSQHQLTSFPVLPPGLNIVLDEDGTYRRPQKWCYKPPPRFKSPIERNRPVRIAPILYPPKPKPVAVVRSQPVIPIQQLQPSNQFSTWVAPITQLSDVINSAFFPDVGNQEEIDLYPLDEGQYAGQAEERVATRSAISSSSSIQPPSRPTPPGRFMSTPDVFSIGIDWSGFGGFQSILSDNDDSTDENVQSGFDIFGPGSNHVPMVSEVGRGSGNSNGGLSLPISRREDQEV
ncbi:hypothetical protein HDU76_004538 [Blyttiomyces sp. JEL0837]|nr:hypothetical protein HDU76_004538 [Blyttiomyces sp. JEL0837]